MAFWRKKEEKKKFDYSDETKELFAERDAFYAEQRRKLGGESSNPELANQQTEESKPKEENLDDLLDLIFSFALLLAAGKFLNESFWRSARCR